MPELSHFKGAIFDVDDTLLDNHPDGSPFGLHQRSRLAAAHEMGKRHGSVGLQNFTREQSILAFKQTKVHSLQATIWQMLLMAGEVGTETIDPNNPLLQEMMILKEELHGTLLCEYGRTHPGSTAFVRHLAKKLDGKVAIASTASKRDIDIYLDIADLRDIFPDTKIVSREQLSHPKPHPDAFNIAFETLGLPESARPRVIVFEDDPRGITSAKAAGLFVCAIETRYSTKELMALAVPPDMTGKDFADISTKLGI